MQHLKPGERRAVLTYLPLINAINALEPAMITSSDHDLLLITQSLSQRALQGEPLSSLLPESFAVVREAARRVLGMRPYDVQLLGGIALHDGRVVEMATGEGKTLVATLPAFLNALSHKGVHIITVNDYLAKRDAEWIGKVFTSLGLSVGVVTSLSTNEQRKAAFAADITYVTAYDLSWTYLNDNMVHSTEHICLTRPFRYCIVDEADSILIDESRNPFVLSQPSTITKQDTWNTVLRVASRLVENKLPVGWMSGAIRESSSSSSRVMRGDCGLDYKSKQVVLTEGGMVRAVEGLVRDGKVRFIRPSRKNNTDTDDDDVCLAMVHQLEEKSSDGGGMVTKTQLTIAPFNSKKKKNTEQQQSRVVYTLSSKSGVDKCLRKAGYEELSQHEIKDEHYQHAVPAVLWDGGDLAWGPFIITALKAIHFYSKDIDYIVKKNDGGLDGVDLAFGGLRVDNDREDIGGGGSVVIVDPATGREKHRSRWQDGVHEAVEAKENISTRGENFACATITYQMLFRYYQKLAGMSGTAAVEAQELSEAYNLTTIRIPPHRPNIRIDHKPRLFLYERGWQLAIMKELNRALKRQQRPVLIGTSSVEASQQVAELLESLLVSSGHGNGGPRFATFNLLNALPENARREAQIIAQAGLPGSVTLATNMAGRGTDILLGGNPKGLTLMTLETYMKIIGERGELLIGDGNGGFDSGAGTTSTAPLKNLEDTFTSEAHMHMGLPSVVVASFQVAKGEVKRYAIEEAEKRGQQKKSRRKKKKDAEDERGPKGNQGLDLVASASVHNEEREEEEEGMEAVDHPWFNNEGQPGSQQWLSDQLEAAETLRSQFLLYQQSRCENNDDNNNNIVEALEAAASWFDQLHANMDSGGSSNGAVESITTTSNSKNGQKPPPSVAALAVQKYTLLQWLWFDNKCKLYAQQVREAGGLLVLIVSVQTSKRSELQLRGRAGRQGDPGETFYLASYEDPVVPSIVNNSIMEAITKLETAGRTIPELMADEQELIYIYNNLADGSYEKSVIGEELRSVRTKLMGDVGDLGGKSLENIARQEDENASVGRESVRKYDEIVDSYRRHVYGLRKAVVCGGEAACTAVVMRHMVDIAQEAVGAFCDAKTSPKHWKLKPLLQFLHVLVNSNTNSDRIINNNNNNDDDDWLEREVDRLFPYNAEIGMRDPFNLVQLGPASASSSNSSTLDSIIELPKLFVAVNVVPDGAEIALLSGLLSTSSSSKNGMHQMPDKPLINDIIQQPSIRHNADKKLLRQMLIDSTTNSNSKAMKGRFAPQLAALTTWIGETLFWAYTLKKNVMIFQQIRRKQLPSVAQHNVQVWEKEILVTTLDILWADFLADIAVLRHSAQLRVMTNFDPLNEFRVESAQLFVKLMKDHARAAVANGFESGYLDGSRVKELSLEISQHGKRMQEMEWLREKRGEWMAEEKREREKVKEKKEKEGSEEEEVNRNYKV